MRKFHFLLIIVSLILVLSGCWDRTEINDLAYVVATGVDKGQKQRYRFSVQVPLPSSLGGAGSSGGGGGTSGEGPFFVARGTGRNLQEGMEDIQARLSRELYFAHRRVLIIGEEQARAGIMEILNSVFIQPQSRLSTFLIVSKGDAVKLLKAEPKMEQFSAEAIREMAKTGSDQTVKDVMQDIDRPGQEAIVPLIETTGTMKKDKNGKEVLMDSFAVFKGDKLSFITNHRESHGILWLIEKMNKKDYSFSVSKDKEMTVRIINQNVHRRFTTVNGRPKFDLSVRVTGTLLENEPNLRIEDPKTYHFIIDKMEQKIKQDIQIILKHSHSHGVDVNGFGWYLFKKQNQKWENNWKNGWEDLLPNLKVNVKVDADIQRTTNSGRIEKE